ncbi:MAG: PAS domain S-box protein [Nostoc sp. ChiSLP02]|nr:PAS domain S-box protein [Nostoc sp. DedSLP05]MDZ8100535.1 PAS domain S-box protein [Nostoc sp. DedSLP01]MDZ8186428.1 PAS domain S-box protein [Nostoc sp. ChiSLP02]
MSHPSCFTILIIDDCAEDREACCRFLQQDSLYTYRTLQFESATQAMQWCQHEIPDIILLDFVLSDGDGLKFIEQFRQRHGNTETAVILLTAPGNETTAVRAIKSGIQDYLVKDRLTVEVLQGAIHHALERMHLTRQLEQSHEQQQLIATIALRIRQSLQLEEILRTTATEVRQFLKADRVLVYQFQPDMSGTIVAESVLPGWTAIIGRQISDTYFQHRGWRDYGQGKKRAIENIYQAELNTCHVHLLEQWEVKAYVVVPILVANQLWGLLIAHQCSASRHWQAVELELLEQLGVQIAIAIQQASAYQQLQAELAERQRTQAALKANKEKLKLTLNFAGIGYWEWNPVTNRIFASQNAIHCFCSQQSDVELSLEQWLTQVHPKDRESVEQELKQAIASQTDYAVEYRATCQDGSIHWVSVKGRGVYDATGQLLQMLGVLMDITERKLSEEQRRRAEMLGMELHFLEQILEVGLAGYWDWDIPGKQQYFSSTFKQMFGYEDGELVNITETWQSLIFPEDLPSMLELFERHVQSRGEIPYYNEVRYRHKDGSTVWVICSGRVIAWDEDGNPLRMVGCHIDITKRKQTEAQLIAINNLQQAILDGSDYAIIFNNSNGIQTFNTAAQKMLGYTADEVINKVSPSTFHDPEELKQRAAALSWELGREIAPGREFFTTVTEDGSTYEDEWVYIRKNGSRFPVSLLVKTLKDLEGHNIGFLGIAKDITRQKQIETALRDSERRYATLTEAAPVGILRLDTTGQCIYANDCWSKITGRPTQMALGMGWLQGLHPEDRHRLFKEWSQGFLKICQESRYLHPHNSVTWFYVQVLPETNRFGIVISYICTLTDITERKQAEAALQESEHRYATLAKAAPVAIFRFDMVGNCVYVNDYWSELTGRPIEAAMGMGWVEALHPDDRDRIVKEWHEADFGSREIFCNEGRHLRPDSSISWFYCHILPETNTNGNIIGYIGTLTDITIRKEAEKQLLHFSERLSLALRSGGFGIWEYDFAQGRQIWDDRMHELYGFKPGDFPGSYDAWWNCLHPEDRDYMLASMKQVIEGKQEYNVEFRIIEPSGKIRYLKAYGILNYNEQDEPVRIIGVNFDISESKQAQQELIRNRDLREAIFNESADAMFLVDPDRLLTLDCNRRAVELFEAVDKTQLIDINGQSLQRRPFTASETDAIVADMQSKGFWSREIEYVTLQGQIFWGNIAAKPITVAGRTMNIVRITDISDRKQAQEALAKYAHEVEDLYNNAPCGYHSLDSEGRLIQINETELQWLGYNREEMIGQPLVNFFTPDGRLTFAHNYPRFKKQGWVKDLEYEMICKDGTVFPVLISATAVKDADGNYLYSRTTLFDIREQQAALRERERAEEELRQTNQQLIHTNIELARATRLKDEFLANMSHELRTPLNAILGMSEGLQESVFGSINERQVKAIATIERSGRHLLELIDDILDLSKIQSGKLELQLSEVSVRSLCDASLAFVKQMALKKNIRLNTQVYGNIGSIQADDRRLRQVLINLLSNAVKFTPEGGSVTLEVVVEKAGKTGENLCFYITDTGIGIAAEDIGKLFQPFIQLDSSLNRQYSGTGLGLALVQQIANLHGGTVSVSSQIGEGSCFSVRILYLPSDNLPTKHLATSLPSHRLSAENAQVLIIEDSVAAADQITRYLSEMGMQPIIYPQGEGAAEEVLRVQPALVILDLQLPNLSGWDVLDRLKSNPKTRDIPAIVISVVDERTKGLAQGAFEYLVKPITRAQLQATIDKLQYPPRSEQQNSILVPEAAIGTPLILLAEDNQANIDTISGYLESRGYRLILASNGQQAIDLVRVQRPDLVVMDIQMPGMDGLEAMRRIRNDLQFVDLPMIALTALAMPGDRETCLAAGANEYLIKPIKLKQLMTTIQQLLKR